MEVKEEKKEEGEGGGRGKSKEGGDEEGRFLLGRPTFTSIGNGRFKCEETGHEMLAKDIDSYCCSKRCRLGLIDAALLHKKPPLNLFQQHPVSKSKLICKFTKDTINKSEEHIWKHISGRRFQNQLEKKEAEMLTSKGSSEQADMSPCKPSKSVTNDVKKGQNNNIHEGDSEPMDNNTAIEEPDFWMPPVGSRWDFDDGNDRWASCTSLAQATNEDTGHIEAGGEQCNDIESESLSMRTKRLAIEVGPSSFASRKKKSKKTGSSSN